MDDPGGIILKLILLLLLILVNAFFAMSEIAVISLNDNKIEKMAEDGHKKAKQVVKLTANSSKFLSTIQIGVTLAGFLTSASASQTFADMIVKALEGTAVYRALGASVVSGLSIVVITIIMSYFSLVLGELTPKKIAMQAPEKISFKVVGILIFFSKVFAPFVKVLSVSTNAMVRLLGYNPHADEETLTEEEIRMMVDVGGEKGVIEDTQKEMINNIFEFDDLDAGDIMTHRTDMTAVDVNDPIMDVVKTAIDSGYSRIPVFDDDPDNIIGIIYVKDLLRYIGTDLPKHAMRKIMRTPMYVPESKSCGDLFKEMTGKHTQMAVVVDEYGGTAGLVTIEDIIEAIVGNIQDEYDDEEEEISKINETTFTIDGLTDIDELDEIIGKDLPEGDYDTIAGYIISQLGYLPKQGEHSEVMFENIRFTVLEVENRRIEKVKVEILPVEEKDDEDDDDSDKKSKNKEKE
ncbi:MAG TPA: HlyC/CorC family transporter [Ruminococcaceae bacterium]|nr:HlyC/CorC family transporter [Oscillospiraceae bacterium]